MSISSQPTRPQPLLTTHQRLSLIRFLNSLPSATLDELTYALDVPSFVMPRGGASVAERNRELLLWVESPMGCGLKSFVEFLGHQTGFVLPVMSQYVVLEIDGDYYKTTKQELVAFLEKIRNRSNSPSLDIIDEGPGSILLTLRGTSEEVLRLNQLINSGELEQVAGFVIRRIREAISFPKADLREAYLPENSNLDRADFQGTDLRDVYFPKASLSKAKLQQADLREARLQESSFHLANLRGANLQGANLRKVNFFRADLREADLRGARLEGATFQDAYLQGTMFTRASFHQSLMINNFMNRGAIFFDNPPNSDVSDLTGF